MGISIAEGRQARIAEASNNIAIMNADAGTTHALVTSISEGTARLVIQYGNTSSKAIGG